MTLKAVNVFLSFQMKSEGLNKTDSTNKLNNSYNFFPIHCFPIGTTYQLHLFYNRAPSGVELYPMHFACTGASLVTIIDQIIVLFLSFYILLW